MVRPRKANRCLPRETGAFLRGTMPLPGFFVFFFGRVVGAFLDGLLYGERVVLQTKRGRANIVLLNGADERLFVYLW